MLNTYQNYPSQPAHAQPGAPPGSYVNQTEGEVSHTRVPEILEGNQKLQTIKFHIPKRHHGRLIGTRGAVAHDFRERGVQIMVPGKTDDSTEVQLSFYDPARFESVKLDILEMLHLNELSEEELIELYFDVKDSTRGKIIGNGGRTMRELERAFSCSIEMPRKDDPSTRVVVTIAPSKIPGFKEKLRWNASIEPSFTFRRFGEQDEQIWKSNDNSEDQQTKKGLKRKRDASDDEHVSVEMGMDGMEKQISSFQDLQKETNELILQKFALVCKENGSLHQKNSALQKENDRLRKEVEELRQKQAQAKQFLDKLGF